MSENSAELSPAPPTNQFSLPSSVPAYKGFNKDLTCRGHRFEIGETYSVSGFVKACENGFHACEHPLNIFEYYPPAGSRFAAVTLSGDTDRDGRDTKIAAAKITIDVELSVGDLVKRAWDYVWSRCTVEPGSSATGDRGAASATGDQGAASATGYQGAASATGDQGAASATGDQGAASATGDRGAASATGDQGAASATGYWGAASATGYRGAASATGYQGAASATGYRGAASATGEQGAASATGDRGAASATGEQGAASATGKWGAASATGYQGKVFGALGNALFAVERDANDNIISVACGIVGQGGLEPDTWYRAEGGKLVPDEA